MDVHSSCRSVFVEGVAVTLKGRREAGKIIQSFSAMKSPRDAPPLKDGLAITAREVTEVPIFFSSVAPMEGLVERAARTRSAISPEYVLIEPFQFFQVGVGAILKAS